MPSYSIKLKKNQKLQFKNKCLEIFKKNKEMTKWQMNKGNWIRLIMPKDKCRKILKISELNSNQNMTMKIGVKKNIWNI